MEDFCISIRPGKVSVNASLNNRVDIDWVIKSLEDARDFMFPKTAKYNCVFKSYGELKINAIKEVRSLTSLCLKEAKDLVESQFPQSIRFGVDYDEALTIQRNFARIGSTVDIVEVV